MKIALPLLLLALGCTSLPQRPEARHTLFLASGEMTCAATCLAPGVAVTAAHCVEQTAAYASPEDWERNAWGRPAPVECRKDGVAYLRAPYCDEYAPLRLAHRSEWVTVWHHGWGVPWQRSEVQVVDPDWMGWLLLDGELPPGASGAGVWGAGGALLAVVVETRDGLTYARRLNRD